MDDLLWAVGAIVGCAGLYYLSTRIEPHWVARDGRRMLVAAQLLDDRGTPVGRKFEARVVVIPDGMLVVGRRRMFRRRQSGWWAHAKSPDPPRRREVYLLRPANNEIDSGLVAITLPAGSRAAPVFDALVEEDRRRSSTP
jgi:hypothetical protein